MDQAKSSRKKALEQSLAAQIADLKSDFSEKELKDLVKSASSIGRIKSADEYGRDREAAIRELLQIPSTYPVPSQARAMSHDVESSTHPSYTVDNIGIILHQFYTDRLQELLQLKHTLLVRWARFAVTTPKIREELQNDFSILMENILAEFNTCLERARSLSIAVDSLLGGVTTPTNIVTENDLITYLRHQIFSQHVSNQTTSFFRTVRWYPMIHHETFSGALSSLRAPKPPLPEAKKPPLQRGATKLSSNLLLPSSRPKPASDHTHQPHPQPLPLVTTAVEQLQHSIQELAAHYSIEGCPTLRHSADELQLFHRTNRRFREIFTNQEEASTLQTYDRLPSNAKKSKTIFKKPSNWVEFVSMRAQADPLWAESWAEIKHSVKQIDEFLALSSLCTHLHSLSRVVYSLRQHYVFVKRSTSRAFPINLGDHKTSHDTSLVWKCIYSGVDSRDPLNTEDTEPAESPDQDHAPSDTQFDVSAAMRLIHNPQGREVSSKASTSPNDAYFSFLMLRHLKIREERHKCLNVLNYFRSIERTLTINQEGLSLSGSHGSQRSGKSSDHLDHRHLFNTPADYKVGQNEFMSYMEVENHDDFYSFEASNQIKVWDQAGVGVVYDSALNDLSELENELLTVATFYLSKQDSSPAGSKAGSGQLDIGKYANVSVDRFAILWEIWTQESNYLSAKTKVVDCYLECYHHTSNNRRRSELAQTITTLLWARPRYDTKADYFTDCYEQEVKCLGLYSQLLGEVITVSINNERVFNEITCQSNAESAMEGGDSNNGLPQLLVPKHLVSLTGDRQLGIHSYLLETAVSLAPVGQLHHILEQSLAECVSVHCADGVREVLVLHCELLESLLEAWGSWPQLGSAFSTELQTNLFSGVVADDPRMIAQFCVAHGNRAAKEAEIKGTPPKEVGVKRLQAWLQVAQLLLFRQELLMACSDTQVLTSLYKQQLAGLDLDSYHAHMRHTPFDVSLRLPSDKELDYFIEKSREGSGASDRCGSGALHLAAHELDDKHVGTISFRTKDDINKLLSAGLECVGVTTTCQISHAHSMLIACQHNHLVIKNVPTSAAGKSSSTIATASVVEAPPTSAGVQSELSTSAIKKLKKNFISLQKEKTPVRDHMLAQFTKQSSSIMRSPLELAAVKCALVSEFSANLILSLSPTSLRIQLIRYHDDIGALLDRVPAVKKSFFIQGKPLDQTSLGSNGKYGASSNLIGRQSSVNRAQEMGGVRDPRQIRARPALLLSKDGTKLMNLWYLPHFTEVLEWFTHLPVDKARLALERSLMLVSGLHMFLQYTCAYVRLGHTHSQGVGGAWGGVESIGSQLLQLQSEICRLSNPSSPDEVGEYLWQRCKVSHFVHDTTLRGATRRALIYKGNPEALSIIDNVSIPSLRHLGPDPAHLPHPLHLLPVSTSQSLMPRQWFRSCNGDGVTGGVTQVGGVVYLSLALLGEEELNIAHGEFLAASLRLDEVLKTSALSGGPAPPRPRSSYIPSTSSQQNGHRPRTSPSSVSSSRSHSHQTTPLTLHSLTLNTPPLESVHYLEKFLKVSYQLERLKLEWGLKLLNSRSISNKKDLKIIEDSYQTKVHSWARKWVAKQRSKEMARAQMESESADVMSTVTFLTETTDQTPSQTDNEENLSELALEQAQVAHLCEMLDNGLIQETSKQLSKQHHLMLNERERDHTSLPLDLWKNNTMNTKEITGLPRSHVVEDFVTRLESRMTEQGGVVTIAKGDLVECVQQLANGILSREKDCYHLYASYYESLLRSQYSQLYQREQEVEHYRERASGGCGREETLVFMGEHTQDLLLEITALRNKVKELTRSLSTAQDHTHFRAQHEYSQLVNNLFSATLAIKSRYEEYRGRLHGNMIQSLHDVRQLVADKIKKIKDKDDSNICSDDLLDGLKGEQTKEIQEENAELSKTIVKMRAVHTWRDHREAVAYKEQITGLEVELNNVRMDSLRIKIEAEQEISSLKQQLAGAEKALAKVERDFESVKYSLNEENRKKATSAKQVPKTQEKSLKAKGERVRAAKIELLKHELESKDKLLKKQLMKRTTH